MHPNLIRIALLACLLTSTLLLPPASMAGDAASLILTNGRIHTADGPVAAMAVDSRGVIVALGEAAAVGAMGGETTRIIDLQGRNVLPGLHDVHVHPIAAGLRHLECSITQGSTLEQTIDAVRACTAAAAPGEWVTGGQWDASALGGVPTAAMLDAVSPANPVVLTDTSGHSTWANTRAMALAGITASTADPEGGIIERDAAGRPSGVFREAAAWMLYAVVPAPTEAEQETALAWALEQMLGNGITSWTDAGIGIWGDFEQQLRIYARLADRGLVKQRVRGCMFWTPENGPDVATLLRARNQYARERFTPDCVKVMMDGVPTDSHTAAMLAPYAGKADGHRDDASASGMLLVEPAVLNATVTALDAAGLAVKFHAAGDGAVRAALDAIAAARTGNGFSGVLHDVAHCTFVAESDLARARSIAATFEVSPYLWGPLPINDSIAAAVGDARMDRAWPVREMLDAGALVIPGSDWYVVPTVNPWIGVETLVTRQLPGGSERRFAAGEAITVPEALQMYTANAARHEGRSDRVGRIAPGMLADVIVVDRDPYAIAPTDIHATAVHMTIINGEVVWTAEQD